MKITRLMAFVIGALITLFFSGVATAQTGAVVSFQGIEISAGRPEAGELYGWMCYAKTSGALPGSLTISMDMVETKYTTMSNVVTSGNWTLPVYLSGMSKTLPIRTDGYQGVVFGSIEAGTVTWDKTGTTATVELKLLIQGGTKAFAEFKGTGSLLGKITYDEKGTGTFDGTIFFELQ